MTVQVEHKRIDDGASPRLLSESADERDAGRWSTAKSRAATRKKILLGVLLLAGCTLLVAAVITVLRDWRKRDGPLIFYTVTRSDLPITVTERGNVESQNNIEIFCEVDDIHGDGIHGTAILWIVTNGSSVKEGDLLVEFDETGHQAQLDQQILDTEKARAEQIKASAKLENQKTQNETAEAEAELQIQLAELELRMFKDQEKGTHQLEVEEINRLIEDIDNQILEAEANLKLTKNDMLGVESLFKLGYAGKSELDRSRLDYLQAESLYAAKLNKLKTQLATLKKKESYEHDMQLLKLGGAQATAIRGHKQVLLDNKALLDQAQAAADAADRALKKEEELLARYQKQVGNCKIFAPQDGMIAYAEHQRGWWASEVRQGAAVRPRQHILSLPNLTMMQVKTAVHESVLNQIKLGLPATIRVQPFQNRTFTGTLKSLAVLPDQSGAMSSDTKVYETIVTIDQEVEHLKPGMSAVVEIHIDRLKDVLSVPVQAVVQIQDDSWCYVELDGNAERRIVQLGRTNDKFVEIREGLQEGDRVVLNPMAIIDETSERESSISPEGKAADTTTDDRQQSVSPSDASGTLPKPNTQPTDGAKRSVKERTRSRAREGTAERPGGASSPRRRPRTGR